MTNDPHATKLVVVETAKSPFEAQVIAAVLRGAGVPVYIGGSMLTDEFAASQRLMGLGGVRVQVPGDQLENARRALVEAREVGVDLDEAFDASLAETDEGEQEAMPAPESEAPRSGLTIGRLATGLLLLLSGLLLGALWTANRRLDPDYGPFLYEASTQGHRYRWKHNRATASETVDADGNEMPEIAHIHNRDGARTYSAYDEDQDGLIERAVTYGRSGEIATTSFDADRDGRFERWQEHHAGGLRIWLDLDADGRFDRVEERNAVDHLLRAWRVDEGEGFVRER